MARVRTTGISKKHIRFNGIEATVIDVGRQRSERKKWIHCFEELNAVVFVVDIAAWDQTLFENEAVNRTEEDLTLFESIVNSPWHTKSHFILLFTKMDKLEAKVKKVPLKNLFPDIGEDGDSIEGVKSYIERRFLALQRWWRGERQIEVVYTSILDGYTDPARIVLNTLTRLLSPDSFI